MNATSEPKLAQTLLDDMRGGDFKRTLRRDWSELKEFYLDQARQARLQQMGWFKRFFVAGWWLIKSLFLKLTPVRRLLLALSFILYLSADTLIFDQGEVSLRNDTKTLHFVLVLFILMLELKDKLLAQSELAAGRSVQRALMPKTSPIVPGWELWLTTIPANEVGGDLVDYLELGPSRFGVALGDVAGKGLKAALLMVKLQATLRALAADYDSLADLGKKLNAILRRDSLPESFVSLVYLELQSNSGEVRWLNAGHMPPLILRNHKLTELPQGAAALGVLAEPAFVEQQKELQHGEVLVLYSDGLIEARNEAGEFFGEQRLANFLPILNGLTSTEIGVRLLSEVERFVGQARAHDDLSLVVLKRVSA
ncbi:MAG: PP2C family protein-serine/threonine phosphatase [candidate division KSB1 bacterium]